MKNLIKTSSLAFIAICVSLSACKRNEVNAPTEVKIDYAAQAKQIGLSFYSNFSKDQSKFKTAGSTERKTLADQPYCGQIIVTPTNSTITVGDTTRSILGNSVFTYLCKNDTLNAYTFIDTTLVSENGTGFNNMYKSTQNYHATFKGWLAEVTGTITAINDVKKLGANNTVTANYHFAAQYTLTQTVAIKTTNNKAEFFGQINFKSQALNKDAGTDVNGNAQNFEGRIIFVNDGGLLVWFDKPDGTTYMRFIINLKTGEVTREL